MATTVLRSCNLCEAGCGLAIEVEHNRITQVRPDPDDPMSEGYVCPKGIAIADVHDDPDRLRQPMRRQPDGTFEPIGWDEAFRLAGEGLRAVKAAHGPNAIGVYYGNPIVHNYGALMSIGALVEAIGTRNRMSASSQDTAPRFGASYYLYGHTLVMPVPDIERTDYFLCVGGNPVVSQGSGMVTPNIRAKLRAIRDRGGKVVTIDPRFTETAKLADEHVPIRPGGDAAFLLAIAATLLDEDLIDQAAIERDATGLPDIETALRRFQPERTESMTGIEAATVRRLARELAAAKTGSVYTRLGICNNEYGTLATWAGDVVNVLLGRLGVDGGALFPEPPLDAAQTASLLGMNGHDRWQSRVRGLPETASDLPASTLAEEIETPGDGQIRAMVTVAGNPVLSTPNSRRVAAAFETLDFMVSIDLYLNETTRHADLVLPPCWSLAEEHSAPLAPSFAIDTHVRFDPPVVQPAPGELAEWQILRQLTEELGGGPSGIRIVDAGLRLLAKLGIERPVKQTLDMILRIGPHGDRFLPWSNGINLEKVAAAPRGLRLRRARPGLGRVRHADRRVHLADGPFLDAMAQLDRELDAATGNGSLLLIGRRHLRSNNSWMHNIGALMSGQDRCVLFVNPHDASEAGLRDSVPAVLENDIHAAEVPVRVTDEVMPGVVSLPHGWGHAPSAPWQAVSGAHAGVSVNDWTDDQRVESIVGQSILNGVPVRIRPTDRP